MTPHRMKQIERRLLAMCEPFPEPSPPGVAGAGVASLLGARARSLYRGFLHATTGPSEPSTAITLRPLVELAIFLKWYSLDPDLHGDLWDAQSDANDLRVINEVRTYLGATNPSATPEAELEAKRAIKRQVVADARSRLKDAGRNYGDRVAPGVLGMVREVAERDPGHGTAMRQAYIVTYRSLSPWVHSEASSFKSTTEPISKTHHRFVGDRLPLTMLTLRILGAAMVAYCIEIVSDFMERSDRRVEARAIRDELVDADAYLARLAKADPTELPDRSSE
jgi:hypothetical protein